MTTLTSGELDVLRVLWRHGELKPAEIQEHFERPIKNAALRFQLRVLLEKGHVVRRRVGKAYYYRPATSRESALRRMARRMAGVFCGGSMTDLIAQLVREEKLSKRDIEELMRFARTPQRKGKS